MGQKSQKVTPPTLHLRCVDPATGAVKDEPVPATGAGCRLMIRRLPGASAIHLLFRCSGAPVLRAELKPDTNDPVPVLLRLDEQAIPRISPGERQVLFLPPDDRYDPPPPLRRAHETGKLDLAFLVDATTLMLIPAKDKEPPRLAPLIDRMNPDAWHALAGALADVAKRLGSAYSSLQTSVMAFGDENMEFLASAADLQCRHVIYPPSPDQRLLRPLTDEQLRARLRRIPATSGGDFVDALAEGLRAAGSLGWRPEARHLLLLVGDSPGFSLLHPAPPGADARVRSLDVEWEALRLHVRHQVEIGSVYAGAPPEALPYQIAAPELYLDFARDQYEALASHHTLFWSLAEFKPELAAEAFCNAPRVLGRRASYGILEEVVA
jgi:hypothetical protein